MDVFAVLADPVRRDLLLRLRRGPARVSDLAAEHPITRPAISRHLRLLREAGVVEATDDGRERPHHLVDGALEPVRAFLAALEEPAPRVAEHRLDALALEVRRTARERRARPDLDEGAGA